MTDENKMTDRQSGDDISRRQFFAKLGMGCAVAAAAGTGAFGYQFLSPNVLYEPSPVVNAGKPDRYPVDSVTLDPETAIYVVHDAQGFFALSAICTHLGCLTAFKQETGRIECPCHGSKFRPDGTKIEGPAPRPLSLLRTWLNEDGELMVDRSAVLTAKEVVRV
ncbi:MAG: ubiquinol-cytochrome c reductase iron-sulfur subunit [Acidobacteriaceae bacterium]